MDIASSAANVVGLVFNFAKAAKTCKAVRGRYKDAAFTIDSIRHQSETLQAALHQLANLMLHDASALTSQWDNNKSLSKTFAATINGLEQTNAKLQADLERLHLGKEKLGPTDKAKVVWNEDVMREHQSRLQSQVGSLQFLLQVLQVGAVSEVKKDIRSLEAALIQASVSPAGNQCDPAGYAPTRQHLILDDQEDLLGLELSEETAGKSFALRKHQSVHLELLEKEFSTDCDATTSACLISDSTLAPSLHVDEIGSVEDPLKDAESVESSPVSQQLQPGDGDSFDKGINSTPATKPPPAIEVADDPKLDPDTDIPELIREVIRGDLEKISNYLDAGHDVDSRHPKNDRTGAMFAAFLNHSKVLSLLLKRGANAAAIDCDGRTALHFAASEGSCKYISGDPVSQMSCLATPFPVGC
ncbi:uncharacterized protein K444DRAFT_14718 [Hyaloscypha bicolor E]|uniref:Uncharacterized protein n=1 Tax=Hyaloscypha bicolor E TaxID=1095630 RepID=A0A2J6TWI3_9HELO|nr:uncharacterized protein K444DRAFT_14718 [Hyaloscypha bicolor E]PMD67380.1 hypothetical protein K444DRAFT_14718 [Hyaloscypha bicolor E]